MNSSQTGSTGRRNVFRGTLVLLVLVVAAFLVSNLLLRGVVERQLGKRTRLHWSVERATWSPWAGVRLSNLRAELETTPGTTVAPVLEIESMRIAPYWSTVLQKRPQFREISVERPMGKVPVQLLSLLVTPGGGGVAPQKKPPVLAGDPDPAAPVEKEPEVPAPAKVPKKSVGVAANKPANKKVPKKGGEDPKVKEEVLAPGRPSRVLVTGGELVLYSLGSEGEGMRIRGIDLDLPVGGPEAEGSVRVSGVVLGSAMELGSWSRKLRWKAPFLDAPEEPMEWQGLKVRSEARLQMRGRPNFSVAAQVLPGKMEEIAMPEWTGLQLGVEEVKVAMFRTEGDLRRPNTWVAEVVTDVRGVQFAQKHWRVGHRFDLGQVVAVFRQGILNVVDARLRSEPLSFMGNGIVATNGQVWSVLRLVADPEFADVINRTAVGSHVSMGWTNSWLRPMGTPDRLFRDLHIEGVLPRVMADVGNQERKLELATMAQMMRAFFSGEVVEQEQVIPVAGQEGASP